MRKKFKKKKSYARSHGLFLGLFPMYYTYFVPSWLTSISWGSNTAVCMQQEETDAAAGGLVYS